MFVYTISDIVALMFGVIAILIFIVIPIVALLCWLAAKALEMMCASISVLGNKLQQRVWQSRVSEDDTEEDE